MKNKDKDLIEINRNKLNEMIENNRPYQEVLKQSELLDEYITKAYENNESR